jgi:hypothetical protein
MNSALAILKELVVGLRLSAWLTVLLSFVVLFLLVGSISMISILTGSSQVATGAKLIITPDAALSQSDLDQLYAGFSGAVEVSSVRYVFGAEEAGHFNISLVPGAPPATAMERFQAWNGVLSVALPVTDPPGGIKAFVENPANQVLITSFLLILALLNIVLFYLSLSAARKSLDGEITILELAGIHPRALRIPFIVYGGLVGVFGALFAGVVLFSMKLWLPFVTPLANLMPEILAVGRIEQMALAGMILGVLVAGIGCTLLGWISYMYPNPLSRSRSSSSSVAVSEA